MPPRPVISSYLLLSACPEKRVGLFGEVSVVGDCDVAVLPHFAVEQFPEDSVHLFYSSCSFSEMDGRAARAYLSVIEQSCRRYVMHDNHDTVFEFRLADGSMSSNVIGSKLVPDAGRFKRLYKKPCVHGLSEDHGVVHFEYLYERL